MTEHLTTPKSWRPIGTPADLSGLDLDRLVSNCGSALAIRVCHQTEQPPSLLVLCGSDDEYASVERLLHQAIADERLRQLIALRSAPDIAAIVDGVLARARTA
jgi:hypothetical protein